MHSLTPGMEMYLASATGILLLALLVVSARFRKTPAKTTRLAYAPSLAGNRRPGSKNKPGRVSRVTNTPAGRALENGALATQPELSLASASQSSATLLSSPVELSHTPIPEEVKMDSAAFPFEKLAPIAQAQISALESPVIEPALPELIPATLAILGSAETSERTARRVETLEAPAATVENAGDAPRVPAEDWSKYKPASSDVLSHFGMPQQPFDVTPDPSYLYSSSSHREALASLKEGIEHFRGFMVMVAEPGMGKTTLLHKLMEDLSETSRVVFLFQTQCSSRDLLCYILNELEVDHTGMDVVAMHRALNQALLEEMLRGRRFVLVVDEAQNLQEPVLETIRLLSDFETTNSKLIQIVLAGQPQLAETLMKPGLVQLRQRIAALASLKALTPTETAEYIEFRLRTAGWSDKLVFSSDALDQIAESSQGVPRRINSLCFSSLQLAFNRGQEYVDVETVKEAAGKLDLESLVRRPDAVGATQQDAPMAGMLNTTEFARALASALAAERRGEPNSLSERDPKASVVLSGTLTEKVRGHGWSKRPEYRVMVTLERDPASGLPVAERYYCCSIYMDESQAEGLQIGKPVRIKIEQD
ncbi:MAG TPA: AAA family ATPase [Candidatus Acidoferrales bacterium]|nr:AAA family ATPase [Candidatus Acidoferrales bacterium]